jgi:hypothetical protein
MTAEASQMVSLIHSAQSYLSLFCSKGDSRILGEFVEKFVIFISFSPLNFVSNFNKKVTVQ